MSLFDDVARPPLGPKGQPGSAGYQLNQYEWDGAAAVRAHLERWYSNFPYDERKNLRGRLLSPDDHDHDGAFFELFLHELLLKLEFEVTVPPEVPGQTRPDFLSKAGCLTFCLEATTSGSTRGPFSLNRNEEDVLRKLDALSSEDFRLGISMSGNLSRTLGKNQILSPFARLIQEHTRIEVEEIIERDGLYASPSESIAEGDWSMQVWLYPVAGNQVTATSILRHPFVPKYVDLVSRTRANLKAKDGKYGTFVGPHIVAVNVRDMHYDGRRHDLEILFGTETITGRSDDGFWCRKSQVDAVIACHRVDVWNLATASACLYTNPQAEDLKLPDGLYGLTHGVSRSGTMEWTEGVDLAQLLGWS